MNNPLLSIVLTGRNDNYGGDFKERLEHCIGWTHQQLSESKILSEIIFVNYNPLPNPAIEYFINWPESNESVSVRIITVPTAVHTTLVSDGKRKNVPLLEYPAKNAGIRRAKGEYILCINPDIILPKLFFTEIRYLRKNRFYRANRIDFTDFKNNSPHNFTKIFLKGHSYNYYNHNLAEYYFLVLKNYFLCKWKLNSLIFRVFFDKMTWPVYFHNVEFKFHCNVSGDFMLMHKDCWGKLKGYREESYISLHTDALMVVQSASFGLKENVLPVPIYHQEHQRRYDATDKNLDYRTAYLFFQSEASKILAKNQPVIYNDDNWGLNKFELYEKIV